MTRPSRYGNPFHVVDSTVVGMDWDSIVDWDHGIGGMPTPDTLYRHAGDHDSAVSYAVALYRRMLLCRQQDWAAARFDKWIAGARGRDLACYCPLDRPCHGDVLLEIANIAPEQRRQP